LYYEKVIQKKYVSQGAHDRGNNEISDWRRAKTNSVRAAPPWSNGEEVKRERSQKYQIVGGDAGVGSRGEKGPKGE